MLQHRNSTVWVVLPWAFHLCENILWMSHDLCLEKPYNYDSVSTWLCGFPQNRKHLLFAVIQEAYTKIHSARADKTNLPREKMSWSLISLWQLVKGGRWLLKLTLLSLRETLIQKTSFQLCVIKRRNPVFNIMVILVKKSIISFPVILIPKRDNKKAMWSSLMFKYYHLEYRHVPCFLGLSSGGSKRK